MFYSVFIYGVVILFSDYVLGIEISAENARFLTNLLMNNFNSQPNELEADEIGIKLAAKSGFDVENGIKLFEKFMKREKSYANLLKYFSTHPTSKERLEKAKDIAKKAIENEDNIKFNYKIYENNNETFPL